MKKTMFLALALLGMVLGSISVVRPLQAQGGPCGPGIQSGDYIVKECGNCLYVDCGDKGDYVLCDS
jgi:hypothetical protein